MTNDGEAAEEDCAALFSRATRGDRVAITTLMTRHEHVIRTMVHRHMTPLVRREGDTNDMIHQVIERVLKAKCPIRIETAKQFCAYMARVVRNTLHSIASRHLTDGRNANRERSLDSVDLFGEPRIQPVSDATGPDERAIRAEQRAMLACAMDLLPGGDQDVLWLLIGDGLPQAEVAVRMGIGESGVRMRRDRALRKLQRTFALLAAGRLDDALRD